MECNDICIAFMHGTSRRVGCECMVGVDTMFCVRWWARYFGLHAVRPEKFQFLEKWQNLNFDYKIVISIKNPEFILWILDEETDFTVGIISRNLAST